MEINEAYTAMCVIEAFEDGLLTEAVDRNFRRCVQGTHARREALAHLATLIVKAEEALPEGSLEHWDCQYDDVYIPWLVSAALDLSDVTITVKLLTGLILEKVAEAGELAE